MHSDGAGAWEAFPGGFRFGEEPNRSGRILRLPRTEQFAQIAQNRCVTRGGSCENWQISPRIPSHDTGGLGLQLPPPSISEMRLVAILRAAQIDGVFLDVQSAQPPYRPQARDLSRHRSPHAAG